MAKVDAGRPVAVTMGDPAGIGPDVTLAAYRMRERYNLEPFYVVADAELLKARASLTGIQTVITIVDRPDDDNASWRKDIGKSFSAALPVVHTPLISAPVAGVPDAANAATVITTVNHAVEDIRCGAACAVVTNPIAKDVLYQGGFTSPGHTEYLAELANAHWPVTCHSVMMIAAAEMRVVPTTIHIPLRDVPDALTFELITRTVRTTVQALITDFGIGTPKIACTGLNPHAGEGGALGGEENAIITPALDILRDEGIDVGGPFPADTLFHAGARARFDAIIAMYHDQALVPIKTLAFDRGVNVTLGLPFVRTSPDHGTAFSIAGSGSANPRSLVEAIKLANEIATRRGDGQAA